MFTVLFILSILIFGYLMWSDPNNFNETNP